MEPPNKEKNVRREAKRTGICHGPAPRGTHKGESRRKKTCRKIGGGDQERAPKKNPQHNSPEKQKTPPAQKIKKKKLKIGKNPSIIHPMGGTLWKKQKTGHRGRSVD